MRVIITSLVIIASAALGYTLYAQTNKLWPFHSNKTPLKEVAPEVNSVDYSGPTDEDTKHSQTAKESLLNEGGSEASEQQNNTETNSASKKNVTVNISFADIFDDNLEIRAFTPTVIEGNGTCTATVSKQGTQTITKTSKAFVDSSSSICQPIYIPKSQLPTGAWNVSVTYKSPTHQGSSGQTPVEVR